MAIPSLTTFYLGLALIVVGTGLLKGNVAVIVGALYGPQDARRDAGFSIFYMGINLGAFIAPLVCGYLGQRVDWHIGFGAAGVGMVLGSSSKASARSFTSGMPGCIRPPQTAFDPSAEARAIRGLDRRPRRLRPGSAGGMCRRRPADHGEADRRRRRRPPARPAPSLSWPGLFLRRHDWTTGHQRRQRNCK